MLSPFQNDLSKSSTAYEEVTIKNFFKIIKREQLLLFSFYRKRELGTESLSNSFQGHTA